MQYKTIQELYLAVGVAGCIVVVFLALFTYLVIASEKKRSEQMDKLVIANEEKRDEQMEKQSEQMEKLVDKLSDLQTNDVDFKNLMQGLTETVKELSTTNRIVADTVSRLDFYNKDLHKKLDRHDAKSERILDEIRG